MPADEPIAEKFKQQLEAFLIAPTSKNKLKLINTASKVVHLACEQAATQHPNQEIGADEWMPVMQKLLQDVGIQGIYSSQKNLKQLDNLCNQLTKKQPDASFALSYVYGEIEHHLLEKGEEKVYRDIYQIKKQEKRLKKLGYLNEASIISELLEQMKIKTNDYLKLKPEDKQQAFNAYQKEIQQLAEQGIQSDLLRQHRGIGKIFSNILISITGVGLIYLAATQKNRHSFWYHPDTRTIKVFKEIKEDVGKLSKGSK